MILYVKTKTTSYQIVYPDIPMSNGEDYALDVFPMADRAELVGASTIEGRPHYHYDLCDSSYERLGVMIKVPLAG